MSIRAYRLLRNNQEQGPFTADEIIQKGLKPYDLIWMDGRSAAWRYPGELAEFKNYAPLPGEESSAKQITKQQADNTISPSVQAAIVMNNTIAESAATQKPRYKVSAAWSKIQTITTPAYKSPMISDEQKTALKKNTNTTQTVAGDSKSLSWKEAWLDWEKEKTDVIVAPEKIKPPASPKKKNVNENNAAPVLETKYSEPLDSLKDKYIDNILLQKQKTKRSFSFGKASEFIIPTLALIVIFSVAYWLMHGNKDTAAALSNALPKKIETVTPVNTNTTSSTIDNNATSNTVAPNDNGDEQKVIASSINFANDQAEDRNPVKVQTAKLIDKKENKNDANVNISASSTVTKKVIDQPSSRQVDAPVASNVSDNTVKNNTPSTSVLNTDESRPVRHRTYDIDDNSNQSSSTQKTTAIVNKPVVKKVTGSYVNVPEYVEMKDGSANLNIQNISDINLDLVVVDVQYFDASNRFRKGETMYLHNLRAGKNIIVKTPKDLNSMYATSKVSLVSSDANNVNVIGDN